MKDNGFIRPLKPGGHSYCVSFMNNYLMHCLMQTLEAAHFIPAMDQ